MTANNPTKPFYKTRVFIFNVAKRTIDIATSIIALVFLSPLLLIIAILIKLTSEGPVFLRQRRVGNNGEFIMYKFRSMYNGTKYKNDMDAFLKENYPELWQQYIRDDWKLPIKIDPRITPIGRFIRVTSIDEMAQFINVLKGEMSLVGPRAYYPYELEEQQRNYPQSRKYVKVILSGKPGLTGVWQVTGRSEINFDKRVMMDARYVKRRSIFYDFWLILKTIPAVISGRGAV